VNDVAMTISEKILAKAAGLESVQPGDYITARADTAVICDLGWSLVGPPMADLGASVIKPERVVVTFDHTVPTPTASAAGLHQQWRDFCASHGIDRIHDVDDPGISHVLSIQKGYARPGTLQVSVDTHANTCGAVGCFATAMGMDIVSDLAIGENWYAVPESIRVHLSGRLRPGVMMRDVAQRVMSDIGTELGSGRVVELVGPFVDEASVPALMTLCNWTRKVQAVAGIVNPTARTVAYVRERTDVPFEPLCSDPDAGYVAERRFDVSTMEPLVAAPPDPLNTRTLAQVAGTRIQQAFLGSCAGGSIEDLRAAASVLAGRHVHPEVRMVAAPSSTETWQQAAGEGLLDTLTAAGVLVNGSMCGACYGGVELLGPGQAGISTSTENFAGRMGSEASSIYLASPLTVAASAIAGRIVGAHDVGTQGGLA
jgi:3-isopropylmalate/(R)-2-methylmalate dehydratase large subunit